MKNILIACYTGLLFISALVLMDYGYTNHAYMALTIGLLFLVKSAILYKAWLK